MQNELFLVYAVDKSSQLSLKDYYYFIKRSRLVINRFLSHTDLFKRRHLLSRKEVDKKFFVFDKRPLWIIMKILTQENITVNILSSYHIARFFG